MLFKNNQVHYYSFYLFFIEILPLSIYRRMFVQADKDLLKQTLDYQVDKVLEETHCEIEDTKEKSESKMRELERSMQVYNDIAMQNVFSRPATQRMWQECPWHSRDEGLV